MWLKSGKEKFKLSMWGKFSFYLLSSSIIELIPSLVIVRDFFLAKFVNRNCGNLKFCFSYTLRPLLVNPIASSFRSQFRIKLIALNCLRRRIMNVWCEFIFISQHGLNGRKLANGISCINGYRWRRVALWLCRRLLLRLNRVKLMN